MTTTFLELGGVKRPFRFSYEGLMAYEKLTGRSAIADFQAPSITFMVNLVYAGLYSGYRKEKIEIDFNVEDVSDWLAENPDAFAEIFALFTASLPQSEEEKKKTPQTVKAKPKAQS